MKAISLEFEAHNKGDWTIYRGTLGTPGLDSQKLLDSTLNTKGLHSLSYGNSLFGGYIIDQGATALMYIFKSYGYALRISIKDYRHKVSIPYDLFFIPPLSTIVALTVAHGEYFHARSKISYCPSSSNESMVSGVNGGSGLALFIQADPLLFSNPKQLEKAFQDYLHKNIIFLTNPPEWMEKQL